jgi:hypothetical protein
MAYKEKLGDTPLQIVEIGCGTAAGANLVTREVHPTAKYLALDMQQAAINTCNQRHATEDNPNLTCQLVPDGVGGRDPKGTYAARQWPRIILPPPTHHPTPPHFCALPPLPTRHTHFTEHPCHIFFDTI